MKRYKFKFDYQFTDLLIIIGSCIGFYLIPTLILSFIGGFIGGFFDVPIFGFLSFSYLLGIAIGSIGSFIYVVRYIIEGIEIYSVEE